jgi:iron complex transport system permease protein
MAEHLSSPLTEVRFAGLGPAGYLVRLGPSVAFSAVVLLVAPLVGSTDISWSNVISGVNPDREIFMLARLPRVLFGALAGGALAVAGVIFQAILRNALATPFTLGVSSGSSFGAVVAIWLGLDVVLLGIPVVSVAAFGGALLTMSLVFTIARSRQALPTFTLLLAGVTLNFVFSALILFIHYAAADFTESFLMIRWMMGGLTNVSYDLILKTAPVILAAATILVWFAAELNALAAGEDWARTRGVDVARLKKTSFVVGSLLTGIVTAVAGPIGFVGLIVPHSLRLMVGPDHRILLPSAFFAGAGFLVLCDTAARTLFAPSEMPVGVLTALLGGPFFIYLLKRRRGDLF